MDRFSPEQRVLIIPTHYRNKCRIDDTFRELAITFGRAAPSKAVIQETLDTFESTGTVAGGPAHSQHAQPVHSGEPMDASSGDVRDRPAIPVRRQHIHPTRSHFHGPLVVDLHQHDYNIQITQVLKPSDHARRRRFCSWMLKQPLELSRRIIFSGEADFSLGGYVDTYNCHIWGSEDHKNCGVKPQKPANAKKTTVWCGIWSGGIIGPYFFDNDTDADGTAGVTGSRYRAMLTQFLWPKLAELELDQMWFQQDGAPAHAAAQTIQLLRSKFGDRVISRNADVNWPPRSCDLTPVDYFLWGLLKSQVYANKPKTIQRLQTNIRSEMAAISGNLLRTVVDNYDIRMLACDRGRGGHLGKIDIVYGDQVENIRIKVLRFFLIENARRFLGRNNPHFIHLRW